MLTEANETLEEYKERVAITDSDYQVFLQRAINEMIVKKKLQPSLYDSPQYKPRCQTDPQYLWRSETPYQLIR